MTRHVLALVMMPALAACPSSEAVPCGDQYCDPGLQCSPQHVCTVPAGRGCGHGDDFVGFEPLVEINRGGEVMNPVLTSDELTMIYTQLVKGRSYDIAVATRRSRIAPFENARLVTEVNSPEREFRAFLDEDKTIYWSYQVKSSAPLLRFARAVADGPVFGAASPVSVDGSPGVGLEPFVTIDGLYFVWTAGGKYDLFFAPHAGDGFGAPQPLDGVNSEALEEDPVLSRDGLALYFTTYDRAPDGQSYDIWVARRTDPSQPFGSPEPLSTVNGSGYQAPSWLSDDNCRLYYTHNDEMGGGYEIRVAWRTPR